ncbi:MAG TPA: TraB/GumN family protein, partial [Nitrosomonas sp.]|nr:TraB/GumN family protein [Nitrosomonas sp.]
MINTEEQTTALTQENDAQAEPIKTVKIDSSSITLLGTAHVSKASADKVQELIATGQYDAVAVELCPSRHRAIV